MQYVLHTISLYIICKFALYVACSPVVNVLHSVVLLYSILSSIKMDALEALFTMSLLFASQCGLALGR